MLTPTIFVHSLATVPTNCTHYYLPFLQALPSQQRNVRSSSQLAQWSTRGIKHLCKEEVMQRIVVTCHLPAITSHSVDQTVHRCYRHAHARIVHKGIFPPLVGGRIVVGVHFSARTVVVILSSNCTEPLICCCHAGSNIKRQAWAPRFPRLALRDRRL